MSVTVTTPDERPVIETNPLDWFDDHFFEHAETCSQCYTRIRDETEHDLDRLGNNNRPTETLERAGDGVVGQAATQHDNYGVQTSYQARTYCSQCGRQSGRADGDHITSKQEIRRICDNIVRRLHRLGYYPRLTILYGTVLKLKSKPDYQGRDREILATAVHLALQDGREASTPGRPRVDDWSSVTR